MTQQAESILRKSLNQVDRERKRTTVLLYALLLLTFGMWVAMMFAKDDHAGIPFGLAAVMVSAFVAGLMVTKVSQDNTRAILKAIELLAQQTSNR